MNPEIGLTELENIENKMILGLSYCGWILLLLLLLNVILVYENRKLKGVIKIDNNFLDVKDKTINKLLEENEILKNGTD